MNHAEALRALERCANVPIILQLDVATVFQLTSMLQLALRHPCVDSALTGHPAREFIAEFREQIAAREPLLAELIDMGFQPKHDIRPRRDSVEPLSPDMNKP